MAEDEEQGGTSRQPPAPSVIGLIDLFVNQAYMGLGAIKDPDSEQPIVDLAYAKHSIDMLELVREKTQGNLTAPEQNYLDNTLYQLRMTFVRFQNNPPAAEPTPDAAPEAGEGDSGETGEATDTEEADSSDAHSDVHEDVDPKADENTDDKADE